MLNNDVTVKQDGIETTFYFNTERSKVIAKNNGIPNHSKNKEVYMSHLPKQFEKRAIKDLTNLGLTISNI